MPMREGEATDAHWIEPHDVDLADRIFVCGIPVDRVTMDQAVTRVLELSRSDHFTYVVTPNAAHYAKINDSYADLGPLYEGADLVVNDSQVVAGFLRLTQRVVLPVVPGSDLTPLVLEALDEEGGRVSIIGMAARYLPRLRSRYPNIEFRHYDPPYGFICDPAAVDACVEFLARDPTPVNFFAVGNPQQERLAAQYKASSRARGVGLCIGAALDFIVGGQIRAPKPIQRVGLEWAFRLALEPKRMAKRYLVESPRFFYYAMKHGGEPYRQSA